MKNSVVVIIPARGGSKGIPKKNIRIFNDKPLVAWTIEQAIEELGPKNVIVSTESTKIFNISAKYGHVYDYKRPRELSRDTSLTEPAMLDALYWYIKKNNFIPEYTMLLQPTSPIRKKGRLTEALYQLISDNSDALLSVTEDHSFFWKNEKKPKPSYNPFNRPRRQDIRKEDREYRENGSIYICKTNKFIKFKCRVFGKISLFKMDKSESFEIDDIIDWNINEIIYKKMADYK